MFKITDNLATHGLGEWTYPEKTRRHGQLEGTDFWIVDVRDMRDESQPLEVYQDKIEHAISNLERYGKIVICCGAGQSRSNAIAIGVLMKYRHMDFYDAYNQVTEKVPIAQIEPCHISALKKLFNVGLP